MIDLLRTLYLVFIDLAQAWQLALYDSLLGKPLDAKPLSASNLHPKRNYEKSTTLRIYVIPDVKIQSNYQCIIF